MKLASMLIQRGVAVILASLCVAGCCRRKEDASKTGKNAPAAKSTADQIIEGITGKTAVDAGMRAKATIQAVNAKRKVEFNEVMGDDE